MNTAIMVSETRRNRIEHRKKMKQLDEKIHQMKQLVARLAEEIKEADQRTEERKSLQLDLEKFGASLHPAYEVFLQWKFLKEEEECHQEFVAFLSDQKMRYIPEECKQKSIEKHHSLTRRLLAKA
jgi:hypothetical protein